MRGTRITAAAGGLLVLIVLMALMGCSGDGVLQPSQSESVLLKSGNSGSTALDEQVQINGRVATIDVTSLTLTLVDLNYLVTAADDCEIVSISAGVETPIEFGDILVGDSVRVCGLLDDSDNILAHRIRVYDESECPDYITFRDSIATIDYAATTFTVFGRTEVVTADANTVVWAVLGSNHHSLGSGDGPYAYEHKSKLDRDTILAFTDLFVGAVVEVKALAVDPNTLYAVSIKLAGSNYRECVTFEASLASVDVDTREVTFAELAWVGLVCQGAELIGVDGEPLTLADFAVGDFVAVKGFVLSEDTLQVCRMEKKDY